MYAQLDTYTVQLAFEIHNQALIIRRYLNRKYCAAGGNNLCRAIGSGAGMTKYATEHNGTLDGLLNLILWQYL